MAQDTRDRVISLLEEKGWNRQQAIGLAANIHAESAFNPAAVGDGGKAYGLAQWHPDRQAEFEKTYGKSIVGSSLEEQVAFMDHELRQGREQSAGKRLLATKTAAEAASVVSTYYERPADTTGEASKRARIALSFGGEAAPGGLPSLKADRPAKVKATDPLDQATLSVINMTPAMSGVDEAHAASAAREAEAIKVQARKDATGISDVTSEGLRDPRVMPTWSILSRFSDDNRQPDPAWDYMENRERIEKGLQEPEREYLRENAVSEQTAQRALGELAHRRGIDSTYADAGAFTAFAGQMAAGITDPGSLVLGLGAVKAFQLAKVGSGALAAQGRGLAAAGSMVAENAVVNVAIEGASDVMGEVKTSADYALAAATGAAFAAPFTRGVFRQANEAHLAAQIGDIQTRAVQEQHAKVTEVMEREPNLTPDQAARRVERDEAEAVTRTVDEMSGPQRLEQVIPDDVRREMTDDFTGAQPEAVKAAKEPRDNYSMDDAMRVYEEARARLEKQEPVIQQIREKGEVARESTDRATGQTVRLSWSADGVKAREKGQGNVAEALEAVATHPQATSHEKALAKYLNKVMSKEQLAVDVRVSSRDALSQMDPFGPQVRINSLEVGPGKTIAEKIAGLSTYGRSSILHETVHVATYHRLEAWIRNAGKLQASQRKVLTQFEDLFERFRAFMDENGQGMRGDKTTGARYAAKDLHEFAAQAFTDKQTRDVLSYMPGKPVVGRASNALREFISLVKRVLGLSDKTALDEAAKLIDQIIAMPVDNIRYKDGQPVFAATPAAGTNANTGDRFNPLSARRSRDSWAQRMTQYAEDYIRRNPINMDKLKVVTAKIGGTSDGLVLAGSQNPIMKLVASLVTETTTGAAGRKANVAIRSVMLHRKFTGNAMIEYDAAYTVFRNKAGGGVIEDAFKGDVRRQFDQKVYEEVLSRRLANHKPNADGAVTEAADALERLFDRARLGQIDGGVLGFANLPGSSKGYMPQALDGIKLQAASVADLDLLHRGLAEQFQARLGWDEQFAKDFAPFYTERARRRSMGEKNIDGLGSGGEGLQLVRDTLEEMQQNPNLVDRARAAQSTMGMGQTKKRLDLDLLTELRPGLRMMDFFNTNPLLMARSYAKRTAGTVSLTEAGIHGIRGIRELRQAAMFKADAQPSKAELDAFDRVMAEILGTPVAGSVVSSGASNMALLVNLQRLGGLVFTQAAETFNMVHHLGWRSVLSGVSELPRLMGEVGRLKKGQSADNHILTSIETYGGEVGMETYKMVAPLDAPEERLAQYVDQPGLLSRAMRAGGHLQSKISGFRGLMAAQHRMVAEQIVMKAARYIRDGGNDISLRDMGFDAEMASAMKSELPHIAKWDGADKLVEFDLTRVSDPRIAEAFVQSVHRGTSQIIQGTFVGERNKWFHNDYLRVLLQLRTFGLTATEKQWGRTGMNHGYAFASGMILAQMAMAAPIHLARVHLMAQGREDRDKYIKDNLRPAAMARALMNYSSMSGMSGDILNLMMDVAGGWGDQRTKELLGARQEANSVGRLIPAAGSIDQAFKVASGRTDLHTALKQLPFSNLWYLVPAINLTKD